MADRESRVALCHGVALKKKGSVEDRESGVALCHKVALKKERERARSVADRESSIAQCHGVALKKKQRKKNDRSWTEREVYRYPSIRYK